MVFTNLPKFSKLLKFSPFSFLLSPFSFFLSPIIPIIPITPTCFHTRIVEDFLGVHDFIPTILTECTLFKKGELRIEVPHLKMLSKSKVMDLLIDAEMPFSEFEAYYKHLQVMSNFDTLVDLSGETLKK